MKYVGYAGYAWDVLQQAVYVLIAWYVLGQLHGRPEALIVPMLGLLYCRQSLFVVPTIAMLREIRQQLKQLEPEPPEKLAIEAVVKIFGSAAIFLLCAWKIYTVLSPQLPF